MTKTTIPIDTKYFSYISQLIMQAKENTFRKINEELILLYYAIGKYLSQEAQQYSYGDKFIEELAQLMKVQSPELKGFTKRNLYRMKQFYELYQGDEIVSSMMTQLTQLAIKEKHKEFLDNYVLEFLDLPQNFSEKEFRNALLSNLKDFILELGKSFTFVGEEYRVQVGNSDFFIDLVFYHRELSCLVAVELKIGEFKPEYLGKMNFYLEALDQEHKKEHENPSVGIILCTSKDDEVVQFALNRSLSPTLIADYTLKLPDSKILQDKLHELNQLISLGCIP